MFILQTTLAVLVSFLAIIAYNEVQNRLAKSRSRQKDLESPGSPRIPATSDVKPPISNNAYEFGNDQPVNEEMEMDKQLYFKLHNLEDHPDILPECRQRLLSLLSQTLNEAFEDPDSSILSITKFSRDALNNFLKAKDSDVTNRWEAYLVHRQAGGSREMFADEAEAKWWLRQAAPVKFVDGAWLGHINKISTPFMYRHITKNAWQVMSEELGDGDLAKNHIYVYQKLMEDIDAGLPAADSEDFIHPRLELNEARCWKAAIAQLLVSLFPHEYLPEALGFNMAYESLPLHLLKTVKELRELRLNPYYFELHISIDNADSGHAAMAMDAVSTYIDLIEQNDGEEAAHIAWKRVQAGYILAEGLPTTPESPSLKVEPEVPFPRNETEAALIGIFAAKSPVAHKIHCNSRLRIGRRSLVDWLEPNAFVDVQWQRDFLHDLSNCKPWVVQGNSDKSRLVRELSWEGKMFGSFTQTEVEIVKLWIDTLSAPSRPDSKVYFDFTRQPSKQIPPENQDIFVQYPIFSWSADSVFPHLSSNPIDFDGNLDNFDINSVDLIRLLPLWFTSTALLESMPSVPARAADTFGSAIVRVLRAQAGFSVEGLGVAGMDEVRRTDDGQAIGIVELGLDLCRCAGVNEPRNLKEAVALGNADTRAFSQLMMEMSMAWSTHRDVLVGMSWAFMEVHQAAAKVEGEGALLSPHSRCILGEIAGRERTGLEVCRKEIEVNMQRRENFQNGIAIIKRVLGEHLVIR